MAIVLYWNVCPLSYRVFSELTMTPNRFADRDLMMRFRGGGVGHKSTRAATDFFKSDRDRLDVQQKSSTDEEEEVNEETVMVEAGLEGYAAQSDEEEDYGYRLGEDSDDENSQEDDGEELDDEDFGPEDDGGAGDPDMEALGYAEL